MGLQILAASLPKERGGPLLRRLALGKPASGAFQRPGFEDRNKFGEFGTPKCSELAAAAIGEQLAKLQAVNPAPHERKPLIGHQPFQGASHLPRVAPISGQAAS